MTNTKTKHISWDTGTLSSTSLYQGVKSIKTLCGKRVPSNRIDDYNADCEACKSRYETQQQELEEAIKAHLTSLVNE